VDSSGVARQGLVFVARGRASRTDASWPLEQRPIYLIRRQIHVALFQRNGAAFEIIRLQCGLLSTLAKRGTADQTTLAADMALGRITTAGALKRKQSRKFVERTVRNRDRRAAFQTGGSDRGAGSMNSAPRPSDHILCGLPENPAPSGPQKPKTHGSGVLLSEIGSATSRRCHSAAKDTPVRLAMTCRNFSASSSQ
jgi:hypothetical protein